MPIAELGKSFGPPDLFVVANLIRVPGTSNYTCVMSLFLDCLRAGPPLGDPAPTQEPSRLAG